jgi:hypothetical protein
MSKWKEDDVTRNDLVKLLTSMEKFAKIHRESLVEQKKVWQAQLDRAKEEEEKSGSSS